VFEFEKNGIYIAYIQPDVLYKKTTSIESVQNTTWPSRAN
jgi:hypothetical protein